MTLANLVLLGWVAGTAYVMARRPGPGVVAWAAVAGVLFLPEVRSLTTVPGMPPPVSLFGLKLAKTNAVCLGLLAGSLWADRRRWAGVRPAWYDLPVGVWSASPLLAAVGNAVLHDDPVSRFDPALLPPAVGAGGRLVAAAEYLGVYDGVAQAVDTALTWAVPYALGRAYLADSGGLRRLARAVVGGGLAYAPLCLFESRVSPQLHRWVYGYHQHDFTQTVRFGGFRPMAFMEHGLAVGLWMATAALMAGWLWWAAGRGRATGRRYAAAAAVLGLTAVACKSTGAVALGLVGLGVLAACRFAGWAGPVVALACLPPAYVAVRTTGAWDGGEVVAAAEDLVGKDRAASLAFRLRNEDVLVAKALARPVVGWGGWGRNRVYDAHGQDRTVTDGLWVIALGERGFVGLTALGLVVLLPPVRLAAGHGRRPWREPGWAAAGAAAVVLVLYAVDGLMNAMVNPAFAVAAGALNGLRPPADPAADAPRACRAIRAKAASRVADAGPAAKPVSRVTAGN